MRALLPWALLFFLPLAPQSGGLELVTVATEATDGFCDLAWSAAVHGFRTRVLGWASATRDFTVATSKMDALGAFAAEAAASAAGEMFVAVDGYDVVVQATPDEFRRALLAARPDVARGAVVLFSGETYCAPTFPLGENARTRACVPAYPETVLRVDRRLACVRKNRAALPRAACAPGPPWDAARLLFPFANIGMRVGRVASQSSPFCVVWRYVEMVASEPLLSDAGSSARAPRSTRPRRPTGARPWTPPSSPRPPTRAASTRSCAAATSPRETPRPASASPSTWRRTSS